MIYPQHFEQKIGFSEIRQLLMGHCLSTLGRNRVEQMTFLTRVEEIRLLHQQTTEFRRILAEVSELPEQDFYDLRPTIQRIRIDGVHLDEKELHNLYLSLRTLHSWIEILRSEEEGEQPSYPALHKLTEGVFTFHAVTTDEFVMMPHQSWPLYVMSCDDRKVASAAHSTKSLKRHRLRDG